MDLDPKTEAAIVATIQELKGQVTFLVISHQPKLVEDADTIYDLSNQRLLSSLLLETEMKRISKLNHCLQVDFEKRTK